MINDKMIKEFQEKIGYHFKDLRLLQVALTHSSYANEHQLAKIENNERTEFLGDAVLELISSDFLFKRDEKMSEGDLSKLRASLVCEQTLAYCAREINLGCYIQLGKGEKMTGGEKRDSILSDALEAVIGSIYLDGGIKNAKDFVMTFVLNDIEHKKLFRDSKTALQEFIQAKGDQEVIAYELVDAHGPEHDREYCMKVTLNGKTLAVGTGRTKQAAGQAAAYQAIMSYKEKNEWK